MALTIANADTSTPVLAHVPGDRRRVQAKVTLDAYVTGGRTLTPSDFGLSRIDAVLSNSTTLGRITSPKLTSGAWTLQVFSAVATEVANAVDLSADSVIVELVGI